MRLIALIPARGGSKRLPGKNLLPLGGKPLIQWSIEVAQNIPNISHILVSTDNAEIAKVSADKGALVPWLRPEELSTDTASSVDVAIHAITWYENEYGPIDGVILLQPTSPLRSQDSIKEGIDLFRNSGGSAVVGVAVASTHPMWSLRVADGVLMPWISMDGLNTRSQDLPPAYEVTGSFYLINPLDLKKGKSFFPDGALPLVIANKHEAIDIDTQDDYDLAKTFLKN